MYRRNAKKITLLALMSGAVLLHTGCADNPLMQSGLSSHTSSVEGINLMLDEAVASADSEALADAGAPLPDNVMKALMPGLSFTPTAAVAEERFDLVVDNLEVREFFRGLVQGSAYNIVVHPAVTGSISLELNKVTVPEVLDIVAQTWGYEFETKGKLIKVLPGGMRTEIFRINYLNVSRSGGSETTVSSGQVTSVGTSASGAASGSSSDSSSGSATVENGSGVGTRIRTTSQSDFWSQLVETLKVIIGSGENRTVVATANAGIVVVRAMPDELRSVKNYLQQAELIMQRQVILEAKILEVTLSDGFEQGIQWNNISDFGKGTNADGSPAKFATSGLAAEQLVSETIGGVFSAALQINDFSSVIQLLGLQGNVQVLSSPRISTVNNQKAVIKVGSDEFFVTDIEIDDTASTTTDTRSADVELTPFFSGISLDVTPQISDDGIIILHVHPSISEVKDQKKVISFGGQSLTLPLALSTIRETDSVISAQDGKIVVIGGLIQDINREVNASTPFLSDIPWLGEAFKQKNQKSSKSELVILLRPTITSNDAFVNDLKKTRERFKAAETELKSPHERTYY
jgi:MSHA biogenesis protein MshL